VIALVGLGGWFVLGRDVVKTPVDDPAPTAFRRGGEFIVFTPAPAGLPPWRRATRPRHPPTAPHARGLGLREVQMTGRLGLTLRQYRSLEAGELNITKDLCERIVELCGWPR
jgi:hypothetical protein